MHSGRKPPEKPKGTLAKPKFSILEGKRDKTRLARIESTLKFHEGWMRILVEKGKKGVSAKQLASFDLQRTVLLDFLEKLKGPLNPGYNEAQLGVIERLVEILEKPLGEMSDNESATVYRLTCSLKL